ncbi:hypothetical protein ACFPYJ_00620 [Paenibacillus solisilvae]|uniref:Uncharacterized protein n=1 Tax=Paenibacillus solisilvae TaxID=2486751 RepID=A0ABW0VSY2_9BACL
MIISSSIPAQLLIDRYWRSTLYLFMNHSKLQHFLTPKYFDFEEGSIEVTALKRIAKPWSKSERFMLDLAFHLYNEQHIVNLSDMDYLDDRNRALAMDAIRLRFFRKQANI